MTVKEAHKHILFRAIGSRNRYEMHKKSGSYGWITCTPEQNAFLEAKANAGEHIPVATLYKDRRKGTRAGAYEAFSIFVVEGVR